MLRSDLRRTRKGRNGCRDASDTSAASGRQRQPFDRPREERIGGICAPRPALAQSLAGGDDALAHDLRGLRRSRRELDCPWARHGHEEVEAVEQRP